MQYRHLDGIAQPLSVLTYGTPSTATDARTRDEAFRSYDLAWEAGFRTFDTAHSYGAGEETLGTWLKSRGHRDEAVILDKGCNPGQIGSPDVFSAQTIREQLECSFRRLQTDHVELYILHRDDSSKLVGPIVEELDRLRREGKLLRYGGSNWTLDRVRAANAYADAHGLQGFTAVSPAYSLADYVRDPNGGSVSIAGDGQKPYRDWLEEERMPVFCYSSLGRGYLSGKLRADGDRPIEECLGSIAIAEYDASVNRARLSRAERMAAERGCAVSQICIAWLLHQPLELFPIIAPSTKAHIRQNVDALHIPLTDEDCDWLLHG